MKRITITLLQFLVVCLHAQKYDNIWMAGAYLPDDTLSGNFTIDFASFPPQIERIPDSLAMQLSSVSISDKNGALAFYTNGCIIRAKNYTTMEQGQYINGGPGNDVWDINCGPTGYGDYPVFEGLFSLPFENGIAEIFHIRFDFIPPAPSSTCTNSALLWTRIDMNANQGLGKVMFKDSTLVAGCLQTACANRHANGQDWWVLLPDNVNQRFYRFLSTPSGIQGPWIQDIANPTIDTFYYTGWSEFSPDGNHLLINDIHTGTAVYDFDRCTGLLSNLRAISDPMDLLGFEYSAAFSPDSRFVYAIRGNSRKVNQYDLDAPDLNASKILVSTWDGYYDYLEPNGPYIQTAFSFFQHGPDGQLYIWAFGSKFMHLMKFPDRKGTDCALIQRAIKLPYYGFGADIYYPNYRLGPIDGSSCDTLGIDNHPVALFRYDLEDTTQLLQATFTDLSYYEPTSWHWDFGDGATSQDTSPVHTYAQAGAYEVCLTVSNAFSTDTYCLEVQVGTSGMHELPVLPQAQVSPNPFGEELRISLPAKVSLQPRFCLYDLFGRQLKTQVLDDFETLVNTSGIPSGIYFWQLSWGGIVAQQGKVLKW